MQRMTQKADGDSIFIIDSKYIVQADGGYAGDAVTRLAGFEDFWEDILSRQAAITLDLDKLRGGGKAHTVRFRELMIKKLTNSNILDMLTVHAII